MNHRTKHFASWNFFIRYSECSELKRHRLPFTVARMFKSIVIAKLKELITNRTTFEEKPKHPNRTGHYHSLPYL